MKLIACAQHGILPASPVLTTTGRWVYSVCVFVYEMQDCIAMIDAK